MLVSISEWARIILFDGSVREHNSDLTVPETCSFFHTNRLRQLRLMPYYVQSGERPKNLYIH